LRRSKAAGESIFEGFSISCMSEAAIDRIHEATLEVFEILQALRFTAMKRWKYIMWGLYCRQRQATVFSRLML